MAYSDKDQERQDLLRRLAQKGHAVGSHGGWKPDANAESWNDDSKLCNNYAYSFDNIALATKAGGNWKKLAAGGLEYEDLGYTMHRRSATSFVAASRDLLRRLNSASK